MTQQEKIALIEEALRLAPNSLTPDTELSTLRAWDSLNILNLQVRLSAINADLQFSDLFDCETVEEVCDII